MDNTINFKGGFGDNNFEFSATGQVAHNIGIFIGVGLLLLVTSVATALALPAIRGDMTTE